MIPRNVLNYVFLLFAACLNSAESSFSLSMSETSRPRGSGAFPANKQKVSIFGAAGYLGANCFGFVQRAGSIYGTGLGGISFPRCIGATGFAAQCLNKVLLRNFKLAFAGEDSIYLTDMADVNYIKRRLKGTDAAVLGTAYQLEKRPVTSNTYEGRNPNAKTYEFYLDDRRAGRNDVDFESSLNIHLDFFRNTMQACSDAGIKHVVVIETPNTADVLRRECTKILLEGDVPFTYLRTSDEMIQLNDFTFESGIRGNLNMVSSLVKPGDDSDDLWDSFDVQGDSTGLGKTAREDMAAVAIQSLISLDWSKSRILDVRTNNLFIQTDINYIATKPPKFDKEWCVRSNLLASRMERLE
uniref:Uncharacterized protein n=1 Tax=Leptocylindrus danicus TaxID=163516 RepID=A0A7S2KEI7_9STRA|mmetsp:Transcript_2196/g.3231  ORF Transcript_2196/g.3231 Transcript_2196/m.3231 type:complete len:355 (+) Transcript_2196:86-1150(+)